MGPFLFYNAHCLDADYAQIAQGAESTQGHVEKRTGGEAMKKRKLFSEIAEGIETLAAKRAGKRFRTRAARGSAKKALRLLEKLDRATG